MTHFFSKLFAKKRPEPSYPTLPLVAADGKSNVDGVYMIGEVAGSALVKVGLNAGVELVERLQAELTEQTSEDGLLDLLVVGAGPAGLGVLCRAKELGLNAICIEANHIGETVYNMMKGKLLLAEPESLENKSSMWFEECVREELLEAWNRQVKEKGLDVHEFEKVTDIQRVNSVMNITTDRESYRAKRVVLAIGKAGNPRKAGVPGELEHASIITHRLIDPALHQGQDLFIYGGGDVALEAAIALAPDNSVTLATIDKELTYPKKRNIDKVMALVDSGKLNLLMDTRLASVGAGNVSVTTGDSTKQSVVPAEHVFEMIGAELPLKFFKKVGIKLANQWNIKRWVYLFTVFIGVYSLYSLKSYGKGSLTGWPYEGMISDDTYYTTLRSIFDFAFLPFGWLFTETAIADIYQNSGFQQGFIYSLLYTLIMAIFGYKALIRWSSVARNPRYQRLRYLSLISFQVGFFLLVNVVAVEALSVKYAWRAWGLYQPFPLFFNTFFWWYDGDPVWLMRGFIGAGLVGTFIAIPIASRNHGKRFCTWICGCGGLAETIGDRWRHLSAKGARSRAWEFQGIAVLLASIMVAAVVIGAHDTHGDNNWWYAYNYLVDFWLVAVIPIALYPFFGGKVWCRYWCPLAAYNGILAKWYGKLHIKANKKCISCTQCSVYCQVGVDVMAFAKNEAPFGNDNSACIQCGICIDVCPMDVLSFSIEDRPKLNIQP
jgi:NosR/NirI family transcriptional regulator, nitrous oxide reductase regulator